jgi:hypothetical protein
MQLQLEASVDLPDAPDGYDWSLSTYSYSLSVVHLNRAGVMCAWIQRYSDNHAAVYTMVPTAANDTRHTGTYDAALTLFAALGLEAK